MSWPSQLIILIALKSFGEDFVPISLIASFSGNRSFTQTIGTLRCAASLKASKGEKIERPSSFRYDSDSSSASFVNPRGRSDLLFAIFPDIVVSKVNHLYHCLNGILIKLPTCS